MSLSKFGYCHWRGVGGQKKPKTCQRSLRTTPKLKKAQAVKSEKYIFYCHLKKETRNVITIEIMIIMAVNLKKTNNKEYDCLKMSKKL